MPLYSFVALNHSCGTLTAVPLSRISSNDSDANVDEKRQHVPIENAIFYISPIWLGVTTRIGSLSAK
jgi:hypothetical protein